MANCYYHDEGMKELVQNALNMDDGPVKIIADYARGSCLIVPPLVLECPDTKEQTITLKRVGTCFGKEEGFNWVLEVDDETFVADLAVAGTTNLRFGLKSNETMVHRCRKNKRIMTDESKMFHCSYGTTRKLPEFVFTRPRRRGATTVKILLTGKVLQLKQDAFKKVRKWMLGSTTYLRYSDNPLNL